MGAASLSYTYQTCEAASGRCGHRGAEQELSRCLLRKGSGTSIVLGSRGDQISGRECKRSQATLSARDSDAHAWCRSPGQLETSAQVLLDRRIFVAERRALDPCSIDSTTALCHVHGFSWEGDRGHQRVDGLRPVKAVSLRVEWLAKAERAARTCDHLSIIMDNFFWQHAGSQKEGIV